MKGTTDIRNGQGDGMDKGGWITKIALIATLALLSGCMGALTGGRFYDYHYQVKADGTKDCHLIIDSGSMVSGATLDICNADGHATAGGTVAQGQSRIDLNGLAATAISAGAAIATGKPVTIPQPAPPPPVLPPSGQ